MPSKIGCVAGEESPAPRLHFFAGFQGGLGKKCVMRVKKRQPLTKTKRPVILNSMKIKSPKAPVKEKMTRRELDALADLGDTVEVEGEDVFDVGMEINPDPGACPHCGGDLDNGDHMFCSRF